MILLAKSAIKFEMETNIFVSFNKVLIKSDVR